LKLKLKYFGSTTEKIRPSLGNASQHICATFREGRDRGKRRKMNSKREGEVNKIELEKE
jgi:hypothetical protein